MFRLRASGFVAMVSLWLVFAPQATQALDRVTALTLAKKYLSASDAGERERLARRLQGYAGDYREVINALLETEYPKVQPGYHPEQLLSIPELREKYPESLLYFNVPPDYRPDRPTGLIIFLHGGGRNTSQYAPRYSLDFPEEGDEPENSQLGDIFNATGMIAVGPSAPGFRKTAYRWCLPESDDYLADVIRECHARFHIDPDRVVLFGHSMGGFGAYHHLLRQPDRFAAVLVNAGSWEKAYWPAARGTPLGIVHGVQDAVKGERWHYTDIAYARWSQTILSRLNLEYTYLEHDGEHGIFPSRAGIERYLRAAARQRRDPFAKSIALASPNGFDDWFAGPVRHNRWLTLEEADSGTIEYDELITNGAEEFDDWRLRYRVARSDGAAIQAVNRGDNTVVVSLQNVRRFTVWLHPTMVDHQQPVTVMVNGRTWFEGKIAPSLAVALESYHRRYDWGLIYPMKIELVDPQSAGR
ncbi:MAG: alpha/beta fold hydrolase [Planctomycetes bacterium]|nr:alpha/beta fold hydrolase [Planctomycetota bacterium]